MIFPHVQIGSFEILDITECLPYLMLLEPLLNSNLEDKIVKDATICSEEWSLLFVYYDVELYMNH